MRNIYKEDRLIDLADKIAIALENKEITRDQAKLILGVAFSNDITTFIKTQTESLRPKNKKNSILFIEYVKNSLNYG
jgi:hypothetical protein